MTSYDHLNDDADAFGVKGGNKPVWAASIPSLHGPSMSSIWELYIAFINEHKDGGMTGVMFEGYSGKKMQQLGTDIETAGAFPHRHLRYHGLLLSNYTDPGTEQAAKAWGEKGREILRSSAGGKKNVYVNFATGDEEKENMYGDRLGRVRELKAKWDPEGWFGHYHPVS
jgi:hypothetical protein